MKVIKYFDPGYFYRKYEKELKLIFDKILLSGHYLKNTKEILEFEKDFSEYIGTKYGLGVASGTDALIIAIESLGIKGKEVIILNNTFVAQIEAVIRTKNIPILVDCNLENYGFLLSDLTNKLTEKTGLIIVSNLYGVPDAIDEIRKIANKFNIKIIEDCSHSHGSLYNGNKLGVFGDIAIFSLNPTKLLGGILDGGIILTNNKNYYDNAKLIANHGRKDKFNHVLVGKNSRLSVLNSVYLDFKLKKINDILKKRQENAFIYFRKLSNIPIIKVLDYRMYKGISFYCYPILLKSKKFRDGLVSYLKDNGIESNIHYPLPISENNIYKKFSKENMYNSIELSNRELSLPIGEHLSIDEVNYIADSILEYFKFNKLG